LLSSYFILISKKSSKKYPDKQTFTKYKIFPA